MEWGDNNKQLVPETLFYWISKNQISKQFVILRKWVSFYQLASKINNRYINQVGFQVGL